MINTPLDAYWNFFTSFNTRDPEVFSSALHYPHVRLSTARTPAVVATAEDHAAAMSWDRFVDAGWDHTTGAPPTLIHESGDRAHIKGGWTRYTKDEKPILTNHVTYIATLGANGWGIQSRFGVDGDLDEAGHRDAVEVVEEYIDAFNKRDWAAAAGYMGFPTFKVDVGQVRSWPDKAAVVDSFETGPWHFITEKSATAIQGGARSVTVAVEVLLDGGDEKENALFYVTRGSGEKTTVDAPPGWRIQARSIMAA